MDGQRVCGSRVRVELTPIEDRRATGRTGGGFGGRGGRSGFRQDSRGHGGGPPGRSSYESRDYGRGGRSGPPSHRENSRFEEYMAERNRERAGGRSNYDRSPPYGGRGRTRGGGGGYSPRGHGPSRMNRGSGYDSGYSEPKRRPSRGRGGDRGPPYEGSRDRGMGYESSRDRGSNYEGSRSSSFRGRDSGYRSRDSNYEYANEDYRQPSRQSDDYRSRGRGRGGGVSSRRGPTSQGDYEPRQRRREDHVAAREREYHAEYTYQPRDEVPSRSRSSRTADLEYREHRSRPGKEEYSHKSDYRRQSSGRMEYHDDLHEPRITEDYRDPKSSKSYRKEEYQEEPEVWEDAVRDRGYRDRSPHVRSPQRHHHRRHHYPERDRTPSPKHSDTYSRSRSPTPGSSPSHITRYRHEYLPREEFVEGASSVEELESAHFEPVDQYIAEEDYRHHHPPAGSRTPSDYGDRDYAPEERHIEYSTEALPEHDTVIPPYEGEDPKAEDIDRDAREVEYKEAAEEDGRFVKMEEAEEPVRYEKRGGQSRERVRRRRYSDDGRYPTRHGSSPSQRRHRSPASPPRTRGRPAERSRSPQTHIRSPIRVD